MRRLFVSLLWAQCFVSRCFHPGNSIFATLSLELLGLAPRPGINHPFSLVHNCLLGEQMLRPHAA
jgi:hypothetical protein